MCAIRSFAAIFADVSLISLTAVGVARLLVAMDGYVSSHSLVAGYSNLRLTVSHRRIWTLEPPGETRNLSCMEMRIVQRWFLTT